jgi:hypothetical protein
MLNIDTSNTAAHLAWSNSIAELCVKKVKQVLRSFCKQTGSPWSSEIEHINNTLNRNIASYGHSPEELMFGQTIPHRDDFLNLLDKATSVKDYVRQMMTKQQLMTEKTTARREAHNKSARDKINKNRQTRNFQLGQMVMLRDLTIQPIGGGSFKNKFTGPYYITKMNDDNNTCVLRHVEDMNDKPKKAHYAHLKPATGFPFPMGPALLENDAARLIGHRNQNTYNLRS